jgi:hypothetical protein
VLGVGWEIGGRRFVPVVVGGLACGSDRDPVRVRSASLP